MSLARARSGPPGTPRLTLVCTMVLPMLLLGCESGAEPRSSEGPTSPSSATDAGRPEPAAGTTGGAAFPVPAGFPLTPDRILGEDRAPTPYSAAEIRAYCREGRINKWRMVSPKGEFISVQRFVSVDANGAKIQSILMRADGTQSGSTEESSGTWTELQGHASYPAARTRIESGSTRVPAGTYDCWVYVVEEGDTITTYWFAKDLAGPPVRVEILRDFDRLLDMQLIEVVTGKR